jgi:hypothetical protein
MNQPAIETRLKEIPREAMNALIALMQGDLNVLLVSINVIQIHLDVIRKEVEALRRN